MKQYSIGIYMGQTIWKIMPVAIVNTCRFVAGAVQYKGLKISLKVDIIARAHITKVLWLISLKFILNENNR